MSTRVLIVDDEPNIVVSLEFLMLREGFEVAVAEDGEQAIGLLTTFEPDLVLLDVMMPKLSGFDVLRQIRGRESGPIVVMLTARGRDAEIEKGKALGADHYVTKPFATKDLVAVVREALEGR